MTHAEPKVGSTIDFSADGKHHRHLSIPHSRNASGWGAKGIKAREDLRSALRVNLRPMDYEPKLLMVLRY